MARTGGVRKGRARSNYITTTAISRAHESDSGRSSGGCHCMIFMGEKQGDTTQASAQSARKTFCVGHSQVLDVEGWVWPRLWGGRVVPQTVRGRTMMFQSVCTACFWRSGDAAMHAGRHGRRRIR